MLKDLLGGIWHRLPHRLRRWGVRRMNARFTVTAAGVVCNDEGQVLLLRHVFRPGSGWGLPGGFIEAGEHPQEGLRRELHEEIGLDVDRLELFETRTFRGVRQIEIVFRCHSTGHASPQSMEVDRAVWFPLNSLPEGLPSDQRLLIKRALMNGVNRPD